MLVGSLFRSQSFFYVCVGLLHKFSSARWHLSNLPSLLFSPRNTDVNFFPLFPLPLEPCSKSRTFTSIISILLLLSSPQGSRKVSSASICRSRHNIWIRITILGCLPCLPTSPWVLSSNSEGTRILLLFLLSLAPLRLSAERCALGTWSLSKDNSNLYYENCQHIN